MILHKNNSIFSMLEAVLCWPMFVDTAIQIIIFNFFFNRDDNRRSSVTGSGALYLLYRAVQVVLVLEYKYSTRKAPDPRLVLLVVLLVPVVQTGVYLMNLLGTLLTSMRFIYI